MNKLMFAIDHYEIMHEDPYQMILDAYIVSEGGNKHETWFTIDGIEKSIPFWANKPVIGLWDKLFEDFKEHARNKHQEEEMKFVGNVPESNKAEIVEYKGKKFLKMKVVIWKAYHPQVANKLASNPETKISMEIEPIKVSDRADGFQQIDEFLPMGICLLGEDYTPAIDDANVQVIKFSTNSDYDNKIKEFERFYSIAVSEYEVPKSVKDIMVDALDMEQKNPSIIKFSKDIIKSDKITYSVITDWFGKMNNIRKDENLLFYGGEEARKWCKDIILKFEKDEDITDFPEEGQNQKISLKNSNFKTFPDYEYVLDIKENYPEIWDDAGNVGEEWNGDKAFKYWTMHRKGEDTQKVLDWIKYREDSWMPRHEGHTEYNGSIAVMKWAGVTEAGVSKMKELINEKKKKIDEKKKMSFTIKDGLDAENDDITVVLDGTDTVDNIEKNKIKDTRKEMYSLKLVDLFNLLSKMVEEKEKDDYGYPMYALDDIDMEKGTMYVVKYGEYPAKYYEMPFEKVEDSEMYGCGWDKMAEVMPVKNYMPLEQKEEAEPMMNAMDKMYSLMVEKGKELKDIAEKYSDIDSKIEAKDTEIEELKTFKFSAIKEKVQGKADKLYEKYSAFIDEEKKKEFNVKLEGVDEDNFDDNFAKDVYAYVVPLMEEKLKEQQKEVKKDDSDGLQTHYSAITTNITKQQGGNSLVDKLDRI